MPAEDLERIEAPYATELARPGAAAVLVVELDGEVRIRLPDAVPDAVRAEVDALGPDRAPALSAAWWGQRLGDAARVRGPSAHAFTDRPPTVPAPAVVEQVAPWRLDRLRREVVDAQWDAAGLDDAEVVFGLFAEPLDPPAWMSRATPAARRTTIASAAGLSRWADGVDDVRVLTAPAYRGRGLATAVGAAAIDLAVRTSGLARWRAAETDAPARAVARRLGFAERVRVLEVDLPPDWPGTVRTATAR